MTLPDDTATPAARIGPYRLVRRIGHGGMGAVWLAHDERLDRPVAVKVLELRSGEEEREEARGARARFQREARAAARLDHPHVASVFDIGETADGRAYLAMVYCEGGSLADRLARGPLSASRALRIARQLASALGAVHEAGIVHRDIKPANVLFDAKGHVRLSDFGIAKLADPGVTRTGLVVGTPSYLAPEQVRGENADARADLWALGVTTYEMLAGRRPFVGDSYAAVMQNVLVSSPTPLHELVDVPRWVSALVSRLLEKSPIDRFQSAAALVEAIDRGRVEHDASDDGEERTPSTPSAPFLPSTGTELPRVELRLPPGAMPLTPVLGRERETALTEGLLERARLVTLTGVGGTGKTRLALEVASRIAARYRDGAHVALLANVTSDALVPAAIAERIGVRDSGTVPLAQQVTEWFAGRHALLLLDNFEHVMGAASFVSSLLAAAPRLTVLVTSRELLHVQGEHELPVPPLALPAGDALAASEVGESAAVQLFVQRASAARADFALTDENAGDVATICRRLDGLPLAIELAAARTRLLAPRAIAARLANRLDLLRSDVRDVDARHRTLRDVIAWSYELLTADEARLFAELSVFAGGFALDAAEQVSEASTPGTRDEVLLLLWSLSDKSLLVAREQADGEPRFTMLETVREFGMDVLRETAREQGVRDAHLAHFLAFIEEAVPHLRGPEQGSWFDRIAVEHDNLRAAMDHALTLSDPLIAARLAAAMQRFWLSRAHLSEAFTTLRRVVTLCEAQGSACTVDDPLLSDLYSALGLFCGVRSDLLQSREYYRQALRIAERAANAERIAQVLNALGWMCYLIGDYADAREYSRAALAMYEREDDPLGIGNANSNLGWICYSCGPLGESQRHFETALARHRQRGDVRSIGFALANVGLVQIRRGDFADARRSLDEATSLNQRVGERLLRASIMVRRALLLHESGEPGAVRMLEHDVVATLRPIGHMFTLAFGLEVLAIIYRDHEDLAAARATANECMEIRTALADRPGIDTAEAILADLDATEGAWAPAVERWRRSLHRRVARGEWRGAMRNLDGLARVARASGQHELGVRLLSGVNVLRGELDSPLLPRLSARHERVLGALEDALGLARFSQAWQEGAMSTRTQLIAWSDTVTAP